MTLIFTLLSLIASIGFFSYQYITIKRAFAHYENFYSFKVDSFVLPITNLQRKAIYSNYTFFEATGFSNLDQDYAHSVLVDFSNLAILLLRSSSEYKRLLEEDSWANFLTEEEKDQFIAAYLLCKEVGIHIVGTITDQQDKVDDVIAQTLNSNNYMDSLEPFDVLDNALSKLKQANLNWYDLVKLHQSFHRTWQQKDENTRLLLLAADEYEYELLTQITKKLDKATNSVIIFGILHALFYILMINIDRICCSVNLLPQRQKAAYYASNSVFFLFIPISVIIYTNEFHVLDNELKSSSNLAHYHEITEFWQDADRITESLDGMVYKYQFFGTDNDRKNEAVGIIDNSMLGNLQLFLTFSTSYLSFDVDEKRYPLVSQLMDAPRESIDITTVNGDLRTLRNEIRLIMQHWIDKQNDSFIRSEEFDQKVQEYNNINLFLLIAVTFAEVIGYLLALLYIIPIPTPKEKQAS